MSSSHTQYCTNTYPVASAPSSTGGPTWHWYAILLVIAAGVAFRLSNLDLKLYWHDEAYTSLAISGYTKAQFHQEAFNGRVNTVDELGKFQVVNASHGIADTLNWLVSEHAQHPPVYYLLARLWAEWFGSQPAAIRSLPALISLLEIPAMYWLCTELFGWRLAAGVGAAIVAVSPFHVLFAQEAREYSLWTVAVLVSGAALLRATRLGTVSSWALYASALLLAIYSHLLSLAVAFGQTLYVMLVERLRWTRTMVGCACAVLAAVLAFLPWLLAIVTNMPAVSAGLSWLARDIGLTSLAARWPEQLTRIFCDLWYPTPAYFQLAASALVIPLEAYSLYIICRHSPRQVWLFVLTLIGISELPLLVPDLVLGGLRSATMRYSLPCFVGVQLSVTYLLTRQITAGNSLVRKCWLLLAAVLIGGEIFSCANSALATTWWNKAACGHDLQAVARIVNRRPDALVVITDYDPGNLADILALTHLLNGRLKVLLASDYSQPFVPFGFSRVFIFNTSREFLQSLALSGDFEVQRADSLPYLWIGERRARSKLEYDLQR